MNIQLFSGLLLNSSLLLVTRLIAYREIVIYEKLKALFSLKIFEVKDPLKVWVDLDTINNVSNRYATNPIKRQVFCIE